MNQGDLIVDAVTSYKFQPHKQLFLRIKELNLIEELSANRRLSDKEAAPHRQKLLSEINQFKTILELSSLDSFFSTWGLEDQMYARSLLLTQPKTSENLVMLVSHKLRDLADRFDIFRAEPKMSHFIVEFRRAFELVSQLSAPQAALLRPDLDRFVADFREIDAMGRDEVLSEKQVKVMAQHLLEFQTRFLELAERKEL